MTIGRPSPVTGFADLAAGGPTPSGRRAQLVQFSANRIPQQIVLRTALELLGCRCWELAPSRSCSQMSSGTGRPGNSRKNVGKVLMTSTIVHPPWPPAETR
ncbi:hypothetical protein [Streptomyces sp. NBC_00842]|uniref:hypothetical protein n=1 Tax=Streptomyces sp. NBC_00842 TaxID=2975848 RepID=UPI003864F73C|nr:hypothetical protein OH821_02645 [Streptomyces sp. NBC_00842]